ncbi:hypothetical protein ACFC1R_38275 [Kitasatospora sp. NPDC056138]|uniref:hypothetical protein n=1 Tax=Kitasatospora sp. NPDC056138 TaxID=3345724 RepID=UPI0035DDF710
MSGLRTAIGNARHRGVLPAFPNGNIRTLATELGLPKTVLISQLIKTLDGLQPKTGGPGGPGQPPHPVTAHIDAQLTLLPGPFNDLRVSGRNFASLEPVEVVVQSTTHFGDGTQSSGGNTTPVTADEAGAIDVTVAVSCPVGATTTHQVTARGSSGSLANTAAVSC